MTFFAYGMVPNELVGNVLERILPLCEQKWVIIVRSIDSSHESGDLAKILTFHSIEYDLINGNVCLSMGNLQKAVSEEVFTGFDEVWIFTGAPPTYDVAALPTSTSDITDFSSDFSDELRRFMEQSSCILIIGDGCGLNFATTCQQIYAILGKG